jgi:hypothetical protein
MEWFWQTIIRYRWRFLASIVACTAVLSFFIPNLRIEEDETTWFSRNDPVLQAYRNYQNSFEAHETAIIAFHQSDPLSRSSLHYLDSLCMRLKKLPFVTNILSLTTIDDIVGTEYGLEIRPLIAGRASTDSSTGYLRKRIRQNPFFYGTLIGTDWTTLGIILELAGKDSTGKMSNDRFETIAKTLKKFITNESNRTGTQFYLGGNVITDAEVSIIIEKDMYTFFPLSLILASLLLFVIFKSAYDVLFPLLSVLCALHWTLAMKGIFDSPITPVSTTLFALITVIGVANSIHLTSQFKKELAHTNDSYRAMLNTFRRAGIACFYTSVTTAMGFGSLSVSSLPVIREMGLFAAFGILSAFFCSMVIVGFGLMLRGRKQMTGAVRTLDLSALLVPIAEINRRYPVWIIAVSLVVTGIMALGIQRIEVESSMIDYLKESTRLRKDAEFIDTHLMGISSIEILIDGEEGDFKNPEILQRIQNFQDHIEQFESVAKTYSLTDYIQLINRALHEDSAAYFSIPPSREAVAQSLLLYEMSGGNETEDFVSIPYDLARISIRTKRMKQAERDSLFGEINSFLDIHFKGRDRAITGFDNLVHETTDRIVSTQVKSLSLAFGIILVIMCLVFGFYGGIISILPNIFPIIFLLGTMGYVGFRLNIATAIIASIAIGIVVDDTIHYFSHFRYALSETRDKNRALHRAHLSVGSALCFTSSILIGGFLTFVLSETKILMHYGILSSVAVITALLGDLFLGPVLLTTFGVFQRNSGVKNSASDT